MTNDYKTVVVVKGVILHEGKALIIKREANARFGGGTWELPGGKIEFGEDLETALVREIKEEAGLDVKVERILYAHSIDASTRQIIVLTYLCTSAESRIVLSPEHMDYHWAAKKHLKQMLPDSTLNDFEKNHLFFLKDLR